MASLLTGAYARIRTQFDVPIGLFGGIEEPLSRIGGRTYRMDAARVLTLIALDQGEKPGVLSAINKYQLTEGNRQCIIDAMDVHGGKGIIQGPNNYLARAYQTLPISITVEGANILTRSMIIFGQGAIRAHPCLLKEMNAVSGIANSQARRVFDNALFDTYRLQPEQLGTQSFAGPDRQPDDAGSCERVRMQNTSGSSAV